MSLTTMRNCIAFLLLQSLLFSSSDGLQQHHHHQQQKQGKKNIKVTARTAAETSLSRRNVLTSFLTSAVAATSTTALSPWSLFGSDANAATTTTSTSSNFADRDQLLTAIARRASDEEVIDIIEKMKDPSNGKGATYSDRLDGEWELIWSYKAEAFSPLLKLPKPFRPNSYQYFGSAATQEVGEGRIAQGLTGGILGNNQFWLSSGAVPYKPDPSVLEIRPPFRFEIGGRYGSGKPKTILVEAGSDAEFRKVNARTTEEQDAGKNQYRQMYLENNGPGSLRISSVIAGDPVIVGEIFVHEKL